MRVTQLMVVEAIKNHGESGCTVKELSGELGIKEVSVSSHIYTILKSSSEDCPIYRKEEHYENGTRYRYFFQTPVPEKEEPAPTKNAEGYSDPTMAKAIKNLERYEGFMPGGIYEFKTRPGSFFLVIRTTPGTLLGYTVGVCTDDSQVDDSTVCWSRGDHYEFVKVNQLTYAKFHWMNKVFDHRCPFAALQKVIGKSPFQTTEVRVVDEDMVNSKAIDLADDYIGTYCNRLAKALGSPMECTKDHYSSTAEWADGLLTGVSVNYANYEKLKNHLQILREQYNELNKLFEEEKQMTETYYDNLTELVDVLGLPADSTSHEDILEAVKTLQENSVDTSSIGATIHALRREASIWKYAFDKVTGGTISENLD